MSRMWVAKAASLQQKYAGINENKAMICMYDMYVCIGCNLSGKS